MRELDDAATAEIALIENVQREDLNAIEEAEGYRQLIKLYGHTQEEVGRLVHKSRSHVANLLRLLDFPEGVSECCCEAISAWAMPGRSRRRPTPKRWPSEMVAEGLSVRQAEALGRAGKPRAPAHRNGGSERARSTPTSPRSNGSWATCSDSRCGSRTGSGGNGHARITAASTSST